MKKLLHSVFTSLTLLLFAGSVIAQTGPDILDSAQIASVQAFSVTTDAVPVVTEQAPALPVETITRIPVRAGDAITISASVLDNTIHKNRFWKSMAKVVVPSFVLGNVGNGKSNTPTEQRPGIGGLSPFNAGVAMIPGAVDAMAKRSDSKVFIGLSMVLPKSWTGFGSI